MVPKQHFCPNFTLTFGPLIFRNVGHFSNRCFWLTKPHIWHAEIEFWTLNCIICYLWSCWSWTFESQIFWNLGIATVGYFLLPKFYAPCILIDKYAQMCILSIFGPTMTLIFDFEIQTINKSFFFSFLKFGANMILHPKDIVVANFA